MSIQPDWPTNYPEINTLLGALLAGVQSILVERFTGLYLHGSLAAGDFNPQSSDIDFAVVTEGELPAGMLPALQSMHAGLAASSLKWAVRLEGPYIPRQALRRYDAVHARHPALRVGGSFDVDYYGADWIIQSHTLREHGIALAGPDPKTLIDPISQHELRQAERQTLREWWAPQLTDHSRLQSREYQAYATLTMCRALYMLQFGAVVSKTAAARWAQQTLDERWSPLIQRAQARPEEPQPDQLRETLAFIQYTLHGATIFSAGT